MNNTFTLTDDRFSAARTDLYDLVFEIQFSRFRFLVRSGDQVLWLEDHFLGNTNDLTACLARCTALLEQHAFLGTRFWKSVKLTSDLQVHTLVPAPAFEASKTEEYLMLAYPTARPDDFEIHAAAVLNQQVITGTLKPVCELFSRYYPGVQWVSSAAVAATYFSTFLPSQTLGVISDTFIDLFCLNGKTQALKAEKTAIRNIRNIGAFTPGLVLFGEVTPYSATYVLLKDRFQTVAIGTSDSGSGTFTPFPEHRYFRLLHT